MIIKPILIFVALVLVSACSSSSIKLHVPQNRFDLPEAVGKKEISAQLGYHSQEYVITLTDSLNSQPVNTLDPPITTEARDNDNNIFGNLTLGVGYGFTDSLEFSFKTDSNSIYIIKYMLLGEPQTRAKAGDWSLALTAGIGASSESGDDYFPLFNSTADYTYLIESDIRDIAVIGGYRIRDRILVYGGFFYTEYNYRVDLTDTDTSLTERFTGDATVNGLNLGVHVGISNDTAIEIEQVFSQLSSTQVNLTTMAISPG